MSPMVHSLSACRSKIAVRTSRYSRLPNSGTACLIGSPFISGQVLRVDDGGQLWPA